jgi:methylmalonyl-CoA mutase N-terminal domain/subunit
MQILGKIWKEGKLWVIECPTLDASTQASAKKEALAMMVDLVQTMVNDAQYDVSICAVGKEGFSMTFKNPTPIIAAIIARSKSSSRLYETSVSAAQGLSMIMKKIKEREMSVDDALEELSDIAAVWDNTFEEFVPFIKTKQDSEI